MPRRHDALLVPFATRDLRPLAPLVGEARFERLLVTVTRVRELLAGRRVINVSSTAAGGGVAEMLQTLLGYARHAGIDVEWLVVRGEADFFAVTKRIHHGLYGGPGDGLELDGRARETYERVLDQNLPSVRDAVRTGDVVIVHDPQPAGLVPALLDCETRVVWRCHIGLETPNAWSERAWGFIRGYVERADAFVFSRACFAPAWLDPSRVAVIPPSIDPFSAKNADLAPAETLELLAASGLVARDGHGGEQRLPPARVVREAAAPGPEVPLVVQVSRWDRMKDMTGVLAGFVDGVARSTGAHLVLAGPALEGVADDPEAVEVWEQTVTSWHALPAEDRARVHLAAVPMEDLEANALVVNALQRHAAVVVQKSLAEGFGLTVAEAMWKSRPVVASAVGGIVEQVLDGESGLLHDPGDLESFGRLVTRVLDSPDEALHLGCNARRRVTEHFLSDRHLLQYAELLERLLGAIE
jgi:trehalose synthase